MNIRTVPNPLVRAAGAGLHRLNQRHPWSHNDHLPLEPALRHAAKLLEPGGRLLVVGLARGENLTDLAWDIVSSLLNPLVGMVKHPRPVTMPVDGCSGNDSGHVMPVREPAETLAEISRIARDVLPGARVRHRLFFRYTLEWTRPGGAVAR